MVSRSTTATLGLFLVQLFGGFDALAQDDVVDPPGVRSHVIGTGWAGTHVNATIFRRDSIASEDSFQVASWYAPDGEVLLASRRLGTDDWSTRATGFRGNVRDAHNGIVLGLDGTGTLHLSWDHHGHPLRYARGVAPRTLELGEKLSMLGRDETRVTYPEFYRFANGDLLFAYRTGASGNGNLVLNRFDHARSRWKRLHDVLIDGESERNAYWQIAIGKDDAIHVSWVWRETPDVRTNHDLCYARSRDGGATWERSDGTPYALPITAATAEYALRIPQDSLLINQTSMAVDSWGVPWIATYWKPEAAAVPSYHVVWKDGDSWRARVVYERRTPFELGGGGTRSVPISRPRLLVDERGGNVQLHLLFRDEERGGRASLASCRPEAWEWTFRDLTFDDLGRWEPSLDENLWRDRGELHVFVQRVGQGSGERVVGLEPQPVRVVEVDL